MRFEVWAPRAQSAEVVVDGRALAMTAIDGSWFVADVDAARPGSRYGFSLDGGPVRPDPRSPSQPDGVHGLSAVVDHAAFAWTDRSWRGVPLASAVLYELHVGTFTPAGTFDAAIDKLPHLVDLGVDVVELLPVNEFPGERGWGYDGASLFAPHHAYGGPEGLQRLVDACHAMGIAVVMDVVYNHLGPDGNYLGEFGPYFTDKYTTPWGMAVNLDDRGSDEVRRFFLDNARMWLRDYHCDGLRVDAVHAFVDTSAVHLLEELGLEVEALSASLGRTLFVIAESDLNDPRVVARREVGGYGMDAQWSDDFHHALHAWLTGERSGYYADFGSLAQVGTALRRAFVYAGDYAPHRGRRHGRLGVGLSGHSFLGYLQNHDQVGNRAQGDRSSARLSLPRLKIAAALVLAAPFVPMLFMGEEWGVTSPFQYFTDHSDPSLGRAVSEGRRAEFASFGWSAEDVPDPQDVATFLRSKLRWSELLEDGAPSVHRDLLAWHRSLIAFRRAHPSLTDGRMDRVEVLECDDAEGRLLVRRGRVLVAANVGGSAWRVPAEEAAVRLSSPAGLTSDSDGFVTVGPDGVALFD